METVPAARPRPAMICASSPPKMADDDRLLVETRDDGLHVVRDVGYRGAGERVGVGVRRLVRGLIARPVDGDRGVTLGLKALSPAVPALCQQPEAVDEDDGLAPGGIGGGNLGRFTFSDGAAVHLGLPRRGSGGPRS